MNLDANDESFKYMARANIKAEKIFRAYTKLVIIISPANLTLMPANSVLICWLETGGFDPKLVYRPFKHLWVRVSHWRLNTSLLRVHVNGYKKKQNWKLWRNECVLKILFCLKKISHNFAFDHLTVCHGIRIHHWDILVS